ncbi:MAG: MotA/TolQ/ExbB proton channel family protein [Paludibacteraceae bacterium]
MTLNIFLQTLNQLPDSAQQMVQTVSEVKAPTEISLWEIVQKGGIIMIPIALLFALSIYVFIERYLVLKKLSNVDTHFIGDVKDLILNNKIESASQMCKRINLPIAKMIDKGIKHLGQPIKEIEESMEGVGKFEIFEMKRGLTVLSVIAGIAPMFGFLGTILGVIKIFFQISQTADVSIGTISSGLYVKMVSSAAGLIVGLIAYVMYYWLRSYINKIVNKMEQDSYDFLEFLHIPQQ